MNVIDKLSMNRTKLALERTLLSYIRTSIVLLSSGVAILKLEILKDLLSLSIALIAAAPLFFFFGFFRFVRTRKKLKQMYEE